MRTLIRNRHGRPLLSRISFTRALRKTRPCSASHHLSKNAQKMANDCFIIHQSLCENKRQKKKPGWRGEWTESSGHFYGRFREFGGCRTRAVTGGSEANGLRIMFAWGRGRWAVSQKSIMIKTNTGFGFCITWTVLSILANNTLLDLHQIV